MALPSYCQNGTDPSFCAKYGGLKENLYSNLNNENVKYWLCRRSTGHLLCTPAWPATRTQREKIRHNNSRVTWAGSNQPAISEDRK